jgi:hypothetical protein
MDRNQTQTWSVSSHAKAMYQKSNKYMKARTKQSVENWGFVIFFKSKGHNFMKNQRIDTKLKLGLYLSMAKQYTKYQMNIWKREQKVWKTV